MGCDAVDECETKLSKGAQRTLDRSARLETIVPASRPLHDFIEEDPMTGRPRGFAATLRELLHALVEERIRGVIIGAGALAAHGAPRYTRDIDILTDDASARKLVRTLFDYRWKGPPPSRDVFFYTMQSPSGVEVDIMGAAEQLYLDAIAEAVPGRFLGQDVLIPTPSHYVLLKLRAAEDSPEDRLKHMSDALKMMQTKSMTNLRAVAGYIRAHEPDLMEALGELEEHVVRARRPPKRRR
jgi:hypothetical protein